MKARALKKVLNGTGYLIADYGSYIGVGSAYVHNLISVDKKSLEIRYALGSNTRSAIGNKKLEFIWDKLHEMAESGEIRTYLDGEDDVDKSTLIKVYTYDSNTGEIIENLSEELGWPNITIDGLLQHNNTYYSTRKEARNKGIKDLESYQTMICENIKSEEKEQEKRRKKLFEVTEALDRLKKLKQ